MRRGPGRCVTGGVGRGQRVSGAVDCDAQRGGRAVHAEDPTAAGEGDRVPRRCTAGGVGGGREPVVAAATAGGDASEEVGQLTSEKPPPPRWVVVQELAPPVGSVEVSTLPSPSTATHGEVVGHDNPDNGTEPSMLAADQAEGPPVGSVEVTTSPEAS